MAFVTSWETVNQNHLAKLPLNSQPTDAEITKVHCFNLLRSGAMFHTLVDDKYIGWATAFLLCGIKQGWQGRGTVIMSNTLLLFIWERCLTKSLHCKEYLKRNAFHIEMMTLLMELNKHSLRGHTQQDCESTMVADDSETWADSQGEGGGGDWEGSEQRE